MYPREPVGARWRIASRPSFCSRTKAIFPDVGAQDVKLLSLFVQLESAAEAEDAERGMREMAGVEDVETFFPRRVFVYDDWFSERLKVESSRRRSESGELRPGPRDVRPEPHSGTPFGGIETTGPRGSD